MGDTTCPHDDPAKGSCLKSDVRKEEQKRRYSESHKLSNLQQPQLTHDPPEGKESVAPYRKQRPDEETSNNICDLSQDFSKLSVEGGHYLQDASKRSKLALNRIIQGLQKLCQQKQPEKDRLTESQASILTPHGPPHGRPCGGQYLDQNGFAINCTAASTGGLKRSAPGSDQYPKFRREKGPSEQDERIGENQPTIDDFDIDIILGNLINDPTEKEMLLQEIDSLVSEDKTALDVYLTNSFQQEMVPGSNSTVPTEQSGTSKWTAQFPESPYTTASSPSSGYASERDAFSPDINVNLDSPARSDCSDISNPAGGALPLRRDTADVYDTIPRTAQEYNFPGGREPAVVNATPQQFKGQFAADDLTQKQIRDMNQMRMLHVHHRGHQWQQLQQSSLVQQIATIPPTQPDTAVDKVTQHTQQVTQHIQQVQSPQILSNNPRPVASCPQIAVPSVKNCGCGIYNCTHRTIAPKTQEQMNPSSPSYVVQPAYKGCQLDCIIGKIDKQELLLARRWVASIKTDELKKSDDEGDLALHILVCQADMPRLIALLERCKREDILDDVINAKNIQTHTLLFLAILEHDIAKSSDMVAILLNYNADPLVSTLMTKTSSTDKQFGYPVQIVAQRGNTAVPIMRELLAQKRAQQINIGCNSKQTPLHYAAISHRHRPCDQMIRLLLHQGADINLKDGTRGRTPLHYLVETQDVQLIQTVLQMLGRSNAKHAINVRTHDRCTALHIAAGTRMDIDKHQALLRLLIEYGADIGAKNAQNHRATDLIPPESRELLSILRGNHARCTPSTTHAPVVPPIQSSSYYPNVEPPTFINRM